MVLKKLISKKCNSKFILFTVILLVTFGCQNYQEKTIKDSGSQESSNSEIITKKVDSKINLKGWEITINGVKYAGQKFLGEYDTYEAAGVWAVVSVNIKNASEKRQREDDLPASFLFSNLVDSNGNEYNLKETEYKYSSDLFGKPFSPGESRTVELLFDIPEGVKVKKFLLDTFGQEPIQIELENNR